jgi:nucleoside-diphosphate-sugar epimerase
MKILVTGARGLLGSELCQQLTDRGHCVVALDNGFRGRANPKADQIIDFDIGHDDLDCLDRDFDQIYHMAAINGTEYFYSMPNTVLSNNMVSDLRLMSWAKTLPGLERFIYASSSEVVAGYHGDSIDETLDVSIGNLHNPRWSYRLSKMCSENYLANSALPWLILRYFNVYGDHSGPGHFVYDIIRKIRKKDYTLIGSDETRCYCHVTDAVAVTVAVSSVMHEVINIGSDAEIDTLTAANVIAKTMGHNNLSWHCVPSRAGSSARRRPTIDRLKSLCPDFAPRGFAQGIREVLPAICGTLDTET